MISKVYFKKFYDNKNYVKLVYDEAGWLYLNLAMHRIFEKLDYNSNIFEK